MCIRDRCIQTVFLSYLLMDDELGSATVINRLLVFSGMSAPNFTLIGNDKICHSCAEFRQKKQIKYHLKSTILSFRGYLVEIELDYQTGWMWIYTARVSASSFSSTNLQCLTRYDFKKLFRFLAATARSTPFLLTTFRSLRNEELYVVYTPPRAPFWWSNLRSTQWTVLYIRWAKVHQE